MSNRKKQGIFGLKRPEGQAGTNVTDEEIAYKQEPQTRFVKNEVTVLGGQYTGKAYTGKGIGLGASYNNASVDVPLDITLGNDRFSALEPATSNLTVSPITDGYKVNWNTEGTSVSNSLRVVVSDSDFTSTNLFEFTASIISGNITFDRYYDGSVYLALPEKHTVIDGLNRVRIPANTSSKAYLAPEEVIGTPEIDFTFQRRLFYCFLVGLVFC